MDVMSGKSELAQEKVEGAKRIRPSALFNTFTVQYIVNGHLFQVHVRDPQNSRTKARADSSKQKDNLLRHDAIGSISETRREGNKVGRK
jgi:hypothetical protein